MYAHSYNQQLPPHSPYFMISVELHCSIRYDYIASCFVWIALLYLMQALYQCLTNTSQIDKQVTTMIDFYN